LIKKIAELATIAALVFAALSYFKIEPNILDEIPSSMQKMALSDVEEIKLDLEDNSIDDDDLKGLYLAASAVKSDYKKDEALTRVIAKSLTKERYKYALLAARDLDSDYKKTEQLEIIVNTALRGKTSAGYAIAAAELIPSDIAKDAALELVMSFYERGGEPLSSKHLSPLDHYEEIYTFADSSNHMNMWEYDAQEFTEQWLIDRTYQDFIVFKEVFTFADASNKMNLSSQEAEKFALDWIDRFTLVEFDVFKQAYLFGDSSNHMGMSGEDAIKFAFKKVDEFKQSNDTSS